MQEFFDSLKGRGLITADQLNRLHRASEQGGESSVRLINRLGYVDQLVLAIELSRHFAIPMIDDDEWPEEFVLPDCISPRFMREHEVLPLRAEPHLMTVAVCDPSDQATLNSLRIASERQMDLRIATESQIISRIERLVKGESESAAQTGGNGSGGNEEDEEQIKDLALDAPVIDLVNRLFREASAARATDLHIEPTRGRVVVRRRIDGILQDAGVLPPDFGRAAVSRIKILTQLNIAERRLPQDGRARIHAGNREYDIRVATMPTIHGESVAIRFLSSVNQVPDIAKLGLIPTDLLHLKEQALKANGLIAVTGPTGSGKTTTLAAVLDFLNLPSRKILTIEDPVEYQVEGVTQIQVRSDIGLTFAATTRAMLRHDPNIIMVGEMRDHETAQIGVNAALAGRLVLTTLHTNSAAGAVTRLLDLGVKAFLIASTLRCVVAQRLVRRLCSTCRQEYAGTLDDIAELSPEIAERHKGPLRLWRAVGCDHCNGDGYQGQAAIFELLIVDKSIRKLIKPDVDSDVIANAARKAGMTSMLVDGIAKCQQGLTTLEELARVVAED
jgi:general secretion pathway protein E